MISLIPKQDIRYYFTIFFTILLSVALAVGMFAVYPDFKDALYAVSVSSLNVDAIVNLGTPIITTAQKDLLQKADNFDRTIMDNTSSVSSLREKSNDNIEVLKTLVEEEANEIRATQQEIAKELKTAMQENSNPGSVEFFEEKLYTNEDTCTQAIRELNSAAEVAVDQITEGQPVTEAFLLIVTDVAAVELFSSFLVVFSVLLQIYLNKNTRHCISVLLNSLK